MLPRFAIDGIGAALPELLRAQFDPYFGKQILDAARFVNVPLIPTPGDLGQTRGMTFGNLVLLSRRYPCTASLYFHELVHVVQYQLLGFAGFMQRYMTGWVLEGFRYRDIPLEQDAFGLQAQFDRGEVFPVMPEIQRRLAQRRST